MATLIKQIQDLLLKSLPHSELNIGYQFPTVSFSIESSNKMVLDVSNVNYNAIKQLTNDFNSNKNFFTIKGFLLKNDVLSFKALSGGGLFLVKFKKPHNAKTNTTINLSGFSDTQYNATYKVFRLEGDNSLILQNTSVLYASVTTGLGFSEIKYIGGVNIATSLDGSTIDKLKYTFENTSILSTDISPNSQPIICYLYNFVRIESFNSIKENERLSETFISIDYTSLVFTPFRAAGNQTDANYNEVGATSRVSRSASLSVYVIFNNNVRDRPYTNAHLYEIASIALNKILNRPLCIDGGYTTKLTIASESINQEIFESRFVVQYDIEFVVHKIVDNDILYQNDGIYPINFVHYNKDTIEV